MFQSTRNPVYKTNMNRLNKQIKKLNYTIEQNSLNNKLININTYDHSLLKFVNPFQKKHKNIPALCGSNKIALTDLDKANCLASSLETQFTLNELKHHETEIFNEHLNENNLLCPEQFGFRPKLSITHQLVRVTEYITEGFTKKQKTGAVFLDIQKAFDRVWKDWLIHKLITLNTPQYLVKIFDSYLTNRSFRVRVKDELSDLKIIQAGVAQGSKVGPVLFSCYINDVPKQFNTLLCMYEDDTAVLAQNKNPNFIQLALNRHLATIEDWFRKWKIAINPSKTEAIMFCKNIKNLNFPQLKINNIQIPWSQECKYLGVILDRKLTWKPHFLYTKKKFRNAARKFYPLISRNSKLHRDNKMLIYTAYLRPILTYSAPVWGYAAKSNIKILESQQNIVIAQICHATWYMRATDIRKALNFPSFKEFIKKLAINFYKSFDNSDNEAIKCISKYKPDLKVKRPRNILIS
ncbi:RNA-directed DNA polymerase from mobile element jockey [Araneus ventricosus]|uniref:RNA-directed DNA polymerase from mobile element jockey n=1 Tax=Araneus ventricosus TaxID=182803 RepID=A0A4Y2URV1_ARAVE|nr:RNA-directed DNA polymerase from mobile element jockey [Araneus ventricosus]GBO15749.1 RNA-directed DNA polymerase from mobile element jockey [Araneus ventricosus]